MASASGRRGWQILGAACGVCALAVPRSTRAQTRSPSSPAGTLAPLRLSDCPRENDYRAAFEDLAAGRDRAAAQRLDEVIEACPSHPHARELRRLAATRTRRAAGSASARSAPPTTAARSLTAPETSSDLARAELIGFQSAAWGLHGGLLCVTFLQDSPSRGCSASDAAGAIVLGATAGGTTAFLTTLDGGVTTGQAMAVNAGTLWGTWNGFAILVGATGSVSLDATTTGALVHGGGLLGTAAGAAVALWLRPRAGQVALVNSAGFWSGVIGVMASLALSGPSYSSGAFAASQLIGVNLGLAAGVVASLYYPTSRGRMFVVDLSALAGFGLALGGIGIASTAGGVSAQALGAATALGAAAGLATGVVLSHRIDVPKAPELAMMPMSPGGLPGLGVGGRF